MPHSISGMFSELASAFLNSPSVIFRAMCGQQMTMRSCGQTARKASLMYAVRSMPPTSTSSGVSWPSSLGMSSLITDRNCKYAAEHSVLQNMYASGMNDCT